jgi:hypothetical protein
MSIVRTPGQTIDPISESARPHVHGASCMLCATWRHSHGASAVRRIRRRRRRARRTGSFAPYVLVNGWVGRLPSTCTRLQSYDAGAELVWLALRPHAHLPPDCHASRARFSKQVRCTDARWRWVEHVHAIEFFEFF